MSAVNALHGFNNKTIDVSLIWTSFAELQSLRALLLDANHGAGFEDLIASLAFHLGLATEEETVDAPGRYEVRMGTVEAVLALFGQVSVPNSLLGCLAPFSTSYNCFFIPVQRIDARNLAMHAWT